MFGLNKDDEKKDELKSTKPETNEPAKDIAPVDAPVRSSEPARKTAEPARKTGKTAPETPGGAPDIAPVDPRDQAFNSWLGRK